MRVDMLVTNPNPYTHILDDTKRHMGLPTCGRWQSKTLQVIIKNW